MSGCAHASQARVDRSPAAIAVATTAIAVASPAAVAVASGEGSSRPPSSVVAAAATPAATPSGPRIISFSVRPALVHSGQTVVWDARTTPDVVSATAKTAAYTFGLTRAGPGHFLLSFTIPPNVPPFFHGTYTLTVTGRTASGRTATASRSVTFQ